MTITNTQETNISTSTTAKAKLTPEERAQRAELRKAAAAERAAAKAAAAAERQAAKAARAQAKQLREAERAALKAARAAKKEADRTMPLPTDKDIPIIVDVYNIAPCDEAIDRIMRRSRPRAAAAYIAKLEEFAECASGEGRTLTAVCDYGRRDTTGTPSAGSGVVTVYHSGKDAIADDLIVDLVQAAALAAASANTGDSGTSTPLPLVVTADRELRGRCEALGATTMISKTFNRHLDVALGRVQLEDGVVDVAGPSTTTATPTTAYCDVSVTVSEGGDRVSNDVNCSFHVVNTPTQADTQPTEINTPTNSNGVDTTHRDDESDGVLVELGVVDAEEQYVEAMFRVRTTTDCEGERDDFVSIDVDTTE